MKNFLSAVYTEMSSRLRTPLLGTFALCWLFYNHDHVAKLIFSDNATRLALIEETPFYLMSDFVIPAVLSLIYIFAIPFVQWIVDLVKYKLIEKRRVATQHAQLLDKYNGQTKVAQQQSKASVEYWQEYHRNNAENAGKRIVSLKEIISREKAQIKLLENQVRSGEINHQNAVDTGHQLSKELAEAREQLKEVADLSEQKYSAMQRNEDALLFIEDRLSSHKAGMLSAENFTLQSNLLIRKSREVVDRIKENNSMVSNDMEILGLTGVQREMELVIKALQDKTVAQVNNEDALIRDINKGLQNLKEGKSFNHTPLNITYSKFEAASSS